MKDIAIHSTYSSYRSIWRKAWLCNQKNCADCDCPAIVVLALRERTESPNELRCLSELPVDIIDLIGKTARHVADSSRMREVCPMTEHENPLFMPNKLIQQGHDNEL